MNFKKIILIAIIGIFFSNINAQQWVLDEIDEERRESGSDSTPIPGLVGLGLIFLCAYLWDQHKKEKK